MPRANPDHLAPEAVDPLFHINWGLERETHRVQADGALARSPHPAALAAPSFTRDFAESQLEIVTRPHRSIPEVLVELEHLTATGRHVIAPELLWPFSMPPWFPDETLITIAEFGPTDTGHRATLYRHGLAARYGKARQMICGVHVNASIGSSLLALLADESPLTSGEQRERTPSDGFHLRLTRNLYRDLPLLVLLTGASPVGSTGGLGSAPFSVSCRNSPRGYARDEFVPYLDLESVEAYVSGVRRGLRTESAAFASLGLVRDGRINQLNGMVFQAEKEFYAPIRLRQTPLEGESGLQAISRRGIGYLELRIFDVDPFRQVGMAEETLRLLHLFLLDDLARPSVTPTRDRLRADLRFAAEVASWNPIELPVAGGARREFMGAAARRLAGLVPWAERLDAQAERDHYRRCLDRFQRQIADPETLPSAKLAYIFTKSGLDWTSFGTHHARVLAQGVEHALDNAGV